MFSLQTLLVAGGAGATGAVGLVLRRFGGGLLRNRNKIEAVIHAITDDGGEHRHESTTTVSVNDAVLASGLLPAAAAAAGTDVAHNITALSGALDRALSRMDTAMTRIDKLTERVAALEETVASKESELAQLRLKLAESATRETALQARVTELESDLAEAKHELANLKGFHE